MKERDDRLGVLRVLGLDEWRNYNVEIDILRSGPVQHGIWEFRNLTECAKTFIGCPILCAYVLGEIGDGHNMEERRGKDGELYESFTGATAERIVGSISENPDDVWTHERDGYTWVTARGKLWRFYAKELVDKIARQGRMSVSAETEVDQNRVEKEDGREIYNAWTGLGVTILGDRVAPAVPNAHIRALAEIKEEFKNCKLRVAALEKEPAENHKPQIETKGVKRMNAIQKQRLEGLFPDHLVVGCSEDSRHVLLMSKKDGTVCAYQFPEGVPDTTVVAENIRPVCASVSYCFEDEVCVNADCTEMMATMAAQLAATRFQVETLTKDLTESRNLVGDMERREDQRRQKAAEDAVRAKLSAVNSLRTESERLDTSLADPIIADCTAGIYNKCSDKDGNWTGADEAVMRLMALVGEADQKRYEDRKASEKKPQYAWTAAGGGESNSDIDGILSYINGK